MSEKIYNIYQKRCSSYKSSHDKYIGNMGITEVISILSSMNNLLGDIYATALKIEDYNGEAKYNEFVLRNKSMSLRSYRNKYIAMRTLGELCKQWNSENPEYEITYGYYPDGDGYCVFFGIYGCKYAISYHCFEDFVGMPYFNSRKKVQYQKANLYLIKQGILNMFPNTFQDIKEEAEHKEKKTKEEKAAEKERRKKERMERKMLRILGDDFLKPTNKPKTKETTIEDIGIKKQVIPTHVGGNRVIKTEVVSGMTQLEKFNARFSRVKK